MPSNEPEQKENKNMWLEIVKYVIAGLVVILGVKVVGTEDKCPAAAAAPAAVTAPSSPADGVGDTATSVDTQDAVDGPLDASASEQ